MESFAGVAAPVGPGEPRAGDPCRVCSKPLPDSLRCGQCGAAYGEAHRCPHCRTITDVEPHGLLRYRCRVCGGPRVPTDDSKTVRTGRERPLLAKARKQQLKGGLWKGAALVGAGTAAVALLSVLAVIAIASPGLLGSLGLLFLASLPGLFAAFAWRQGKALHNELADNLNQAWLLAASDVIASHGEVEASQLATILRISEAQAELLLAELSVQDFVHARVSDDGMLSYLAPSRMRVAASGSPPTLEEAGLETSVDASAERATAANYKR